MDLPADGGPVTVWVGGEYPFASTDFGDTAIEVRDPAGAERGGTLLAQHPTMVRIRKDANTLTDVERKRFLDALATLNGAGQGAFRNFREMHASGAPLLESHGDAGFLPWHRAYILDLERELQKINGEVTLPYSSLLAF